MAAAAVTGGASTFSGTIGGRRSEASTRTISAPPTAAMLATYDQATQPAGGRPAVRPCMIPTGQAR